MSHLYVIYALDHTISVVKAESKVEAFDIVEIDLVDMNYQVIYKY